MTTTLNFKDIIDVPRWRSGAPVMANTAAGATMSSDSSNGPDRNPIIYLLRSAALFECYDPTTDQWMSLVSPALTGTYGAGATSVYHTSQGPRGTLAAGATTSKVTLTTALPAAVGINQLANRGDGVGRKIRIVGSAAGSSGKIEERTIVANTGGTTPTIWLDTPLTFTPVLGDGYEFRAGRIFMLSAGTTAAGCWKYYDNLTNSFSGNLSIVNLPATIGTDSSGHALAEDCVPWDRKPGEGFVSGAGTYNVDLNCIVATAAAAATITGAGMPADLQANEYRNFQIKIVEDTTTPTAVNQRRRIASHTGGATGVFTVAAWAVTPSSTAKFVVENDDDKILLRSSATTAVYCYNITANTWDITTFATAVAHGAGVCFEQAFGTSRDTTNNHRHSFIYCIRGGGVNAIDVLDIAGAATGVWSNDIVYGKKGLTTFTTGTCSAYDGATLGGRLLHINQSGTQRYLRFDMQNRIMDAETYLRYPPGAALVGDKMCMALFQDGTTKLSFIYSLLGTSAAFFSLAIQR